jgi:hypothetical protein
MKGRPGERGTTGLFNGAPSVFMAPLMGPFLPRRQWREGESNRE